MKLVGSNSRPHVTGVDELPGRSNYVNADGKYLGVLNFAKVKYEAVYPGVDAVYYGNQRQLEYDFVVAPSADPRKIILSFTGAAKLRIDRRGDLVLRTDDGEVRQQKPIAYQDVNGRRQIVACRYVLEGNRIRFALGSYDATKL